MNKTKNVRRVLSLLFVMVMLVSMMVVGTVTASAAESTNVAKNANTGVEYATLQAAIDAAQPGDTVEFLKNITLGTYVQGKTDAAVTVKKAITLDGKGFTLTSKAGRAINVGDSNNAIDGTVKIENLTIKQYAGRNSSDQKRCINIGIGANVEVTNCNLQLVEHYASGRTLTSYVAGVQIYGANSTATINGSTISTIYGIVNYGVDTTFNIKDSTIEKALYCAWINAETTVNVENSDLSTKTNMGTNNLGVAFLVQAGNVEVSVDAESSITVLPPKGDDGTATGGQAYAVYSSASAETPAVIDIQATVEKTDSTAPVVYLPSAEAQVLKDGEYVMYYTVEDAVDNLEVGDKIEGLTVSQEAIDSALDNAGLKVDENGNVAKKGVAQIGENVYETLAEAIANANAGDIIYLLADVEGNVTITKSVTINGAKAGTDGELADDRYNYTGVMTVKSDFTVESLNIKGRIDVAGSDYKDFTARYCSFDGQGLSKVYAINLAHTYDVVIENCEATNYHYGFLQTVSANSNLTVTNVDVTNCLYAFTISYCSNVVAMTNVSVDNTCTLAMLVSDYNDGRIFNITDCTFTPNTYAIGFNNRGNGYKSYFTFNGTNTLTGTAQAVGTIHLFELAEGATLAAPAGLQITPAAGFTRVYNEGVYSLVKTATLNGYLALGSAIDVNFVYYGDKTLVNDVEVVVTYGEKTYKLGLSDMYVNSEGQYVYSLKGVFSAKQMTDEFTVVVMYKDHAISELYKQQSVKSIATTTLALEDISVEAKNLIVALLNYGAEAQKSFNYNADNLANAGVAENATHVDLTQENNDYTDDDNDSYYAASANLKNELQFNLKFFADKVAGYTDIVVTANGVELDYTVSTDTKKDGTELIVVTVNLSVVKANEVITVSFKNGDEVIASGADSILSYCVRAYVGLSGMSEADRASKTCGLEFYQALADYIVIAHGYANSENN